MDVLGYGVIGRNGLLGGDEQRLAHGADSGQRVGERIVEPDVNVRVVRQESAADVQISPGRARSDSDVAGGRHPHSLRRLRVRGDVSRGDEDVSFRHARGSGANEIDRRGRIG